MAHESALEKERTDLKRNFLSLRTLLGFAVAAAVIYLFFKNFDMKQATEAIATARWPWIIPAIAVFYLSLPLRGKRWSLLIRPTGVNIDYGRLSHYFFLSWFANAILPARIGDIYRAYLLRKNNEVPVSLSLGAIFSERIFDLAVTAVLVIISGAYFWNSLRQTPEAEYIIWGLALTLIIILAFAVMAIVLPGIIKLMPEKWRDKVSSFRDGIFKWPSLLPIIILMTAAIWLSEAMRLFLVFQAFGIKAGFMAAVFISQAALILMSLPLSPAGLGLVELLMLHLLSASGISPGTAAAITIVDRLISYWSLVASGGAVYVLSPRVR